MGIVVREFVAVSLVLAGFIATGAAATPTTLALFTGNNQSGTVGQALANPLVVRATDANYDPVSGVLVIFTVTAGGGSLSVLQALTDVQGQASTVLTLGPSAGRSTVTATSASLSGSPVTFTATGSSTTGTGLCGGLFDDTTWTKAQSPYIVTCPVTLFPGKTLTIEPGVVVRFNPGTGLTIRGVLRAVGRPDDRITLNSVNPPSPWSGVHITTSLGGKVVISFADFSYAATAVFIECCGVSDPATISDSTFRNNGVAFGGLGGTSGVAIVKRSTFENNETALAGAYKHIFDSVFRNNTYGLRDTDVIYAYGSTFEGNQVALYGVNGGAQGCVIARNGTGVQGSQRGIPLTGNLITGNNIGVILSADDEGRMWPVEQNDIYGNTRYNAAVSGSANKVVPNNWWGTTDTAEIDAKILDGRDDARLGLLEYVPFLTGSALGVALPNPRPVLSTVSPNTVLAGSPAFTIVLTGAGFNSSSIAQLNGGERPTVFVSDSILQTTVPANAVGTPRTVNMTVFNPLPGGGRSTVVTLTVFGKPGLAALSPATVKAGSPGFRLVLTGSEFRTGAVVLWNGDSRPTTFISSTALSASIPSSDIAAVGVAQITVSNPAPTAAVSDPLTFTVAGNEGPCVYSFVPAGLASNSSGGTGGFEVRCAEGCPWLATSNAPWIVLTAASGQGPGAVSFSFATNTSTSSRSGTITVAGQALTVTQSGAPSSVSATAFEPRLVRNLATGFYILEATLGPQALGGFWGMEVITSLGQAAGGFNLGGGVSPAAANPGFGAFLLSGTQTVTATLNAQVSPGTLMTLRFLDSGRRPIGDPVMGIPPLTLSRSLDAGFYVVEVYSSGPAPFNFQLGLATDFFVGGVNTGGYLGPGNVGFGAFYVPETQDVTMKFYGRSTYGSTGAGDLVLTLRDADRKILATVPP